jgi:hypothetical protein
MIAIFIFTKALIKPNESDNCIWHVVAQTYDPGADEHNTHQKTRTEMALAVARGLAFMSFLLESIVVFCCEICYIGTPQYLSVGMFTHGLQ